jgi:hypothetical protein
VPRKAGSFFSKTKNESKEQVANTETEKHVQVKREHRRECVTVSRFSVTV